MTGAGVPSPTERAEALAWLRENSETLDWLDAAGFSGVYIANVVRAALADSDRAETAPHPTDDERQYAIIEVKTEDGIEYPVVERNTNGPAGWRSGARLFVDADVTHVRPLALALAAAGPAGDDTTTETTTEPDGEDDGVLYWLVPDAEFDVSVDNTAPGVVPPRFAIGGVETDVQTATRLRDALTAAITATTVSPWAPVDENGAQT